MKDEKDEIELTLFDLIARDLRINQEIYKTWRGNFTALKGYLPGIGNPTVRETVRLHVQDGERVLASLVNQTGLMLHSIKDAKDKWKQQQPKQVTSTAEKIADGASAPVSSLESPPSSSALAVVEPEKSQSQQA